MSERSRASYLLIGCTYAASAWLVACGGGGGEEQLLAQAPPGQQGRFIESRQDHGTGNITFTFSFSEPIKTTPAFSASDPGLFTVDDVEIIAAVEDGASAPNGVAVGAVTMTTNALGSLVVDPVDDDAAVKIRVAALTFEDLDGNPNRQGAEFTHRPRLTIDPGPSIFICTEGGNKWHFDCNPESQYTFFAFGGDNTGPNAVTAQLVTAAAATSAASGAHGRFLEVVKPATGGTGNNLAFAGAVIDQPRAASGIPFTATATQMTMRIWSPIATDVLLKVENAVTPTDNAEALATISASEVNKWMPVPFNFITANKPVGSTAPDLDPSKTYDRVTIFPSFAASGPAAAGTFYFDEVGDPDVP